MRSNSEAEIALERGEAYYSVVAFLLAQVVVMFVPILCIIIITIILGDMQGAGIFRDEMVPTGAFRQAWICTHYHFEAEFHFQHY